MGTRYHVTVVDTPGGAGRREYQSDLDAVLARVDRSMSTWRADSEISRLNAAPVGVWFPVSAELYAVLAEALAVHSLSGGGFDVTVAPVLAAWGFGPGAGAPHLPSHTELDALAGRVGSAAIELADTPPRVRKNAARQLELGAIAPGYAVDLLAAAFAARGARNFMIELGGEVRTAGRNGAGQRWRIGVEQPDAAPGTPAIAVELEGESISTSGDYREFFVAAGQRFSHTIDPRTRRPVAHSLASVTVIAGDCMRADAMATALMVLGPEAGLALAEREGLAVFLVLRTEAGFETRESTRLGSYLRTPAS